MRIYRPAARSCPLRATGGFVPPLPKSRARAPLKVHSSLISLIAATQLSDWRIDVNHLSHRTRATGPAHERQSRARAEAEAGPIVDIMSACVEWDSGRSTPQTAAVRSSSRSSPAKVRP